MAEVEAIIARALRAPLTEDEGALLRGVLSAFTRITQALEAKNASIDRLRQIAFGATTEKTAAVLAQSEIPENTGAASDPGPVATGLASGASAPAADGAPPPKKKRKGHGRNGMDSYTGATRVRVAAPIKSGERCPCCQRGRVYSVKTPPTYIRLVGMPPLQATVTEYEQVRCNGCLKVYDAKPEPGPKYDASAVAQIGDLTYGNGVPFNRLDQIQEARGVPLPAQTQWDLVHKGARDLLPVFRELLEQAARADVVHNDDTTVTVLELTATVRAQDAVDKDTDPDRTGAFTTGIVARTCDGHDITVYVTGPQHAGENLADMLVHRPPELPPVIQMCDALSRNTDGEFVSLVANCLAHGRRNFVSISKSFPTECRFVLETLRTIFRNDATALREAMTRDQRLAFHQDKSRPAMRELAVWLRDSFDLNRVEPNSTLGQAVAYLRNHWLKLTLFLRVPGAPIDNNICERALKKAIRRRKNSMFFKSLNGALVSDIWMSLIQTAEGSGIAAYPYLTALLRNSGPVRESPADWTPWNYEATLARLNSAAASVCLAA